MRRFLLGVFAYLIALTCASVAGVVASILEAVVHTTVIGGDPHLSVWVLGFVTGAILFPLDHWLYERFIGESV